MTPFDDRIFGRLPIQNNVTVNLNNWNQKMTISAQMNTITIYYLYVMLRNNFQSQQLHDAKKILCVYHPTQVLINFCCDQACLMPLCPNCIVEHTEQHFIDKTRPIYLSLNDLISETRQKCYQHIVSFEELSKGNQQILHYINNLKDSLHNQLCTERKAIINRIEQMFQDYEGKLLNEVKSKFQQLHVFDKQEADEISDFMESQIAQLQADISDLKNQSCLSTLISYLSEKRGAYTYAIQQIREYIDKHKTTGVISISNNQQILTTFLENIAENVIKTEYISFEELKDKQSNAVNYSQIIAKSKQLSKQNNINSQNLYYEDALALSRGMHSANASTHSKLIRTRYQIGSPTSTAEIFPERLSKKY